MRLLDRILLLYMYTRTPSLDGNGPGMTSLVACHKRKQPFITMYIHTQNKHLHSPKVRILTLDNRKYRKNNMSNTPPHSHFAPKKSVRRMGPMSLAKNQDRVSLILSRFPKKQQIAATISNRRSQSVYK